MKKTKKTKSKTSKRTRILNQHGVTRLLERVLVELRRGVRETSVLHKAYPNSEPIKDRLCVLIINMTTNPLVSGLGVTLKDVMGLANKGLPEDLKITKEDLLIREDLRVVETLYSKKAVYIITGEKKRPEDI